jgi:uncharacterized protein YjgD (DUF1641 family)
MAQPIPLKLTPKGADPAERLEDALHKHTDAIVSALELLQLLHDRGVLDLLRGLVGAGDQLAGILTAAAGAPDSLHGIRNFILLTKFFASIPPDVLDGLVRTASARSGARESATGAGSAATAAPGGQRGQPSRDRGHARSAGERRESPVTIAVVSGSTVWPSPLMF